MKKRTGITASDLTNKIAKRYKTNLDNSFRNTRLLWPLIILLATLFVGGYSPSTSHASYIISQTQIFGLQTDAYAMINDVGSIYNDGSTVEVALGNNHLDETTNVDLQFDGAPSSIIVGESSWELTGMTYSLSSFVDYTYVTESSDSAFCDAWVVGYYNVQHYVSDQGFLLPGQNGWLSNDAFISSPEDWAIEDDEGNAFGAEAYSGRRVEKPMQQYYALTNENDQLSSLYVDNFTIRLQRRLIMDLINWDDGDDPEITFFSNLWNGILSINYLYDPAPDNPQPNNPVPEPATLLLLGSGLIGLAGFSRKKK